MQSGGDGSERERSGPNYVEKNGSERKERKMNGGRWIDSHVGRVRGEDRGREEKQRLEGGKRNFFYCIAEKQQLTKNDT